MEANTHTDEANSQTHRTDPWVPGRGLGVGIRRSKLSYTGWTNRVLLYRTGHCIHCPVTSKIEKNMRNNRFVYDGATPLLEEMNTTLSINYTGTEETSKNYKIKT